MKKQKQLLKYSARFFLKSPPESVLDLGSERGSEKEQWQIWDLKASNFGWATSGWASCNIDCIVPYVWH